jgi:hypothetical protein
MKMGCNPDTGIIRELLEESEAKPPEVVFKTGELITIKGCLFMVQQICGDPHNTITLKGTCIKQHEANMI